MDLNHQLKSIEGTSNGGWSHFKFFEIVLGQPVHFRHLKNVFVECGDLTPVVSSACGAPPPTSPKGEEKTNRSTQGLIKFSLSLKMVRYSLFGSFKNVLLPWAVNVGIMGD